MTAKVGKTPTYRQMWPVYAGYWDRMEIRNRQADLDAFVKRALAGKPRYQAVEQRTKVPWWMIAIIAERESTQNFDKSLAQGDPWRRRSTHVPKERGPFQSWEDAAVDALHYDGLDAVPDWRLEKVLYYLERYNGWGYWLYHNQMPSPYVWGATSIQKRGKYDSDKHWNPNAWDGQLGGAAMLKALMAADPSIQPVRET